MNTVFKPEQPILWGLLSALLLVCAPHFLHLPLWVTLGFILALLWRYAHDKHALPLPNWLLRLLLLVLILAGVLLSFHSITGRDAGVAFLVLLIGLKLLEMREFREFLLLLFLSYFLIFTNFLYSQSIFSVVYLLLVMLLSTAILIRLADKRRAWTNRQCLHYSGRLLAQALPLMLALFIFFPRIDSPFWQLPENSHNNSVSGISSTLELGNLSSLSLSDEVAFRVKFDGAIPPPSERYWRGLVLNHSHGKRWTRALFQGRGKALFEPSGTAYQYTITLEPHQQNWLYSLDLPPGIAGIKDAVLREDFHIHSKYPINSLKQYHLKAYTHYRTYFENSKQAKLQWRNALHLEPDAHPKTRALAQAWQQDNPDPAHLVQRALTYFNTEAFFYTLEPPLLNGDVIDTFLFNSRAGFCEHYAAAFVTLMRAASVPARIVLGYQGGSMNPFGDYLIVRQRDAHAWAEVWLDKKGWIRVDPTTAVSPLRVEAGIESALPEVLNSSIFNLGNIAAIQQWKQWWDLGNNYWNQWVLGYGSQNQANLLKYLGLELSAYKVLTLVLIIVLASLFAILALWLLMQQQQQKPTKLSRLYQRFCARLADCGIKRLVHEGADTYALRAIEVLPAYAVQIRLITRLYVQLSYRITAPPSKQELTTLERAVTGFKPKTLTF